MSEKGLTNISLKKINKSKVYQYIYRKKKTSKQQIVQELQMGLSTVSQNLNRLEPEGLIEKNGFFASTGGRKANAIQIVSDFKISIGIGILISSHPGCVLLPKNQSAILPMPRYQLFLPFFSSSTISL